MENIFTKPVPLPKPKKYFYQKCTCLPRPRKLAHSPINMFVKDIDKFEEKEMTKRPFIKNNWYDWLIHHIPEPIRKTMGGVKGEIMGLFNYGIIIKVERNQKKKKKNIMKK